MNPLEQFLVLTLSLQQLAVYTLQSTDTKQRFLVQQDLQAAIQLASAMLDYYVTLPDGLRPPQTSLDQVENAQTSLQQYIIDLGQPTPEQYTTPAADIVIPLAVNKGGTGAITPSQARFNLGAAGIPVSIAQGGTGATTQANARTSLDVYSKGETAAEAASIAAFIASGIIAVDRPIPAPIANGGTNADTAAGARANLDVYSKAEVDALIAGHTHP